MNRNARRRRAGNSETFPQRQAVTAADSELIRKRGPGPFGDFTGPPEDDQMLDARFRPLPRWERKPGLRYKTAQFKTPYNKTLDKLEYEIRHLNGRDIRIEAGYELSQIRNDGFPRGGMRPSHPGVVLYFETKNGSLCFPCGTYGRLEDNMHAIALTLECLRAVDRYGVTVGQEQYRGFTALPSPPKSLSVEDAAEFIHQFSGAAAANILLDRDTYRRAYREAAMPLHPDRYPDKLAAFHRLQEAKSVLDKHHGLAREAAQS